MDTTSLINGIQDGKLKLSLHPGCVRIGHKQFTCGPIGRKGPGCSELPPWKYSKPKCASLYFTLNIDDKDEWKYFDGLIKKIDENDNVQFERSYVPSIRITSTLKPEFKQAVHDADLEYSTKLEKFNEYVKGLEELGVDTEELCFQKQSNPNEWYDYTSNQTYSGASWTVSCDEKSVLYQELDKLEMIDAAVPEWYRLGSF